MGKSLAQIVAELPEEERAAVLAELDPEALMYDWSFWGRPEQQAPEGDWSVWLLLAGRGFGKLFALDTPIRTVNGWKPIGEIEDGDEIFDENGQVCRVVKAHTPEVPERMYRLTFSDGSKLEAGGEHQWVTWTHSDRKSFYRSDCTGQKVFHQAADGLPEDWVNWTRLNRWGKSTGIGPKIRTTDEIVATFRHGKRGDLNHSIPMARPLDLPKTELPIDPYLLGFWLGDGTASGGQITQHKADLPELEALFQRLGYEWVVSYGKPDHPNTATINVKGLAAQLRELGLINNKHIPPAYLNACVEDRRALLAGLLDSDGTVGTESGVIEFCSVIPELANQTLELIRSLGEKPRLARSASKLYGVRKKDRYRITWRPIANPFRYERKAKLVKPLGAQANRNLHRMITAYEAIEPVMSRCLTVDSPNSMYLAGEALIPTHNTRTAAEWVREEAKYTNTGQRRFALVARTAADVRDVLVEGDAGVVTVSPPSEKPHYEPSKRRLTWPNGNIATLYTADEPDSLRGGSHTHAWGDEIAAWRQSPDAAGMTAFDNLRVAVRSGNNPKMMVTTTPKRVPLLYKLLKEADETGEVVVTRGSTMDNAGNLSEKYVSGVLGVYEGTALARQELYGEMLSDTDGAMWVEETIESARHSTYPLNAPLRIIGVDPSVAENPGDECGIVVVASTGEHDLYKRNAWVLEDASLRGSPDVWANRVVEMARKWGCPVVAEVNQGGALVKNAIHTIDPNIKVLEVHSKQGKALRAEPISMAYQQGRVHHVGWLQDLESQMYSWVPGTGKSPDRIDALVHALTALLIKPPSGFSGGRITAKSLASRRLPDTRGGGGGFFRVR